jgi:choline-sulfatase
METRPDVLFVVLDSLRTDHVSSYGSDRETTPALDTFARGATVYENAYVPAPWTLPSHCSMFTGAMPSEHGVTNGFTDRSLALPRERDILTEVLADRGYRAAGFSNNPWVGQLSGLDRGFDRFVEWDLDISRGNGAPRRRDEIYSRLHSLVGRATKQPLVLLKRPFFTTNLVDRAARWIRTSPGPSFTFLNLMEAHSPYYPPDWAFEALDLPPPNPVSARSLNTKLLASVLGKRELSDDEQRRVHEFLDACVRFQDQQLDRLLATLREQGRYEDALIVVCSDHGKTLGEFDRDGVPSHYTRDINVRVPLVVKYPDQTAGERVAAPAELARLHDLILDPAPGRVESPDGHAYVEDFVPHTASESQDVDCWRVVTDAEEKLVNGPDSEYFMRGRDADERVVPAEAIEAGTKDRLRERLTGRVDGLDTAEETAAGAEAGIDDGLESQLHDLGYLG